jgi:uncharacterized protein (DUF58 family)
MADTLAELLAEVRRIELQSRRLVAELLTGGYTSVFRGSGLEFDRVREYAEGDDPRAVDWNVTARMGRPFVKTYVDERELTVLFLLDCSASMDAGFGAWSARQAAARIGACLALSAARNNDKVGLIAFSDGVDKYVAPKKGPGHALRVVRDCLALPGADLRTNPAPALEFAARVVRRHAIVFLLSDFRSDPRTWQHPLTHCARRHDVVAVRVLTPEREPPPRGLMRVRDPETGAEHVVDWSSARVRAAYAKRTEDHRLAVEEALRRAKVDRMDVPLGVARDPGAISGPIVRFFRMREARGAKR